MTGSATDAGLDGSKLAAATNSIVAVIQYRLGAVSQHIHRLYNTIRGLTAP